MLVQHAAGRAWDGEGSDGSIPACVHPLLYNVLRNRWNSSALVQADNEVIYPMFQDHHYYKTLEEAVVGSINAGVYAVDSGGDVDIVAVLGTAHGSGRHSSAGGCDTYEASSPTGIADTAALAGASQLTVLALGLGCSIEAAEGQDCPNLYLPGGRLLGRQLHGDGRQLRVVCQRGAARAGGSPNGNVLQGAVTLPPMV